jgi:hypothetical protein
VRLEVRVAPSWDVTLAWLASMAALADERLLTEAYVAALLDWLSDGWPKAHARA